LSDVKRETGLAYGATDSPSAEFAKRITYVIGGDGRILQVHPKVDPKGHPKAILGSL
jgi:peroxiredoxin